MYSKENYRLLLSTAIHANYQFSDFTSLPKPDVKQIFLRHAVIWNPTAALELAKENYELGILGTFFFDFRSNKYNLMAYRDEIDSIHTLGQKLGLMYTPRSPNYDDKNPLTGIMKDFEIFALIVPNAQAVFLWPDVPESVNALFKDHFIPGMNSVHDPAFQDMPFYDDVDANYSFSELISFVEKQYPKMVLSLNPDRWIAGGQDAQQLNQNLQSKTFKDRGNLFVDE